ncbi:MAG: hypothetical protein FJW27_05890 [Acidimicrobiia bacterium]|nr:hypothetical protein [Acidimicrobiia bacterium]
MVHVDADIVDVAVSNPAFSTLVTAVTAAGLVNTLKGPGPFTVFAPTDAAFAGLPSLLLNAALSDPRGLLTSILTYHVASGIYDPRYALIPREIRSVQGQGCSSPTIGVAPVSTNPRWPARASGPRTASSGLSTASSCRSSRPPGSPRPRKVRPCEPLGRAARSPSTRRCRLNMARSKAEWMSTPSSCCMARCTAPLSECF